MSAVAVLLPGQQALVQLPQLVEPPAEPAVAGKLARESGATGASPNTPCVRATMPAMTGASSPGGMLLRGSRNAVNRRGRTSSAFMSWSTATTRDVSPSPSW
jgi:hypothetical protein